MNIHETISDLIHIPEKFNRPGNISLYSLLKASGYFENYDQILETNIYEALVLHPECVKEWMFLSENKRTNSGWYINKNDIEKYAIGYFPQGKGGDMEQIEYSDPIKACAAFIKREIEDMRTRDIK